MGHFVLPKWLCLYSPISHTSRIETGGGGIQDEFGTLFIALYPIHQGLKHDIFADGISPGGLYSPISHTSRIETLFLGIQSVPNQPLYSPISHTSRIETLSG